jgi:pilus assembly protein CpaE
VAETGEKFVLWVTPGSGGDHDLVRQTVRELGLEVRFCPQDELLPMGVVKNAHLVAVEFGDDPAKGLALVKDLHDRLPRMTILAASENSSLEFMRSTLESGASDLVSMPLTARELHRVLLKFTQVQAATPAQPDKPGEVITVLGARGGLGVTTLAVNLALRLQTLANASVAIADLDLQRSDVAAFLNMQPIQSWGATVGVGADLDETFVRGIVTRHSSGIYVLVAPNEIEEAEGVGPEEVRATVSALRSAFGFTVIDTPRTLTGTTLAALEQTDVALLVTDLSVPGVRAARRVRELLVEVGVPSERLQLVITDVSPGPVKVEDLVRAVGREPLGRIARDVENANQAMNEGVLLNGAPNSPLAKSIDDLAAKLAGVEAPKTGRRWLLPRLFKGKKAEATA